jgi:hypothetical protein
MRLLHLLSARQETEMTAKLLIIPSNLKLPPKLRRKIQDGGYIIVPEDQQGSVRVVDPLPDLSITNDSESLWLIQNLLDLVLTDSYSSLPKKLGERLVNRVKAKIEIAANGKEQPNGTDDIS